MPSIHYEELEFTHFVEVRSDGSTFGCARENGSGKIRVYLITAGVVKAFNGEHWYALSQPYADLVKQRAASAFGRVPTLHIDQYIF